MKFLFVDKSNFLKKLPEPVLYKTFEDNTKCNCHIILLLWCGKKIWPRSMYSNVPIDLPSNNFDGIRTLNENEVIYREFNHIDYDLQVHNCLLDNWLNFSKVSENILNCGCWYHTQYYDYSLFWVVIHDFEGLFAACFKWYLLPLVLQTRDGNIRHRSSKNHFKVLKYFEYHLVILKRALSYFRYFYNVNYDDQCSVGWFKTIKVLFQTTKNMI